MPIKFVTLVFLFSLCFSCNDSDSNGQGDPQNQGGTGSAGETPGQEENQNEDLYTITIRGDWPAADNIIQDLYFANIGSGVEVKKHFTRNELAQAHWCVALRKSDFSNLSIRLQLDVQETDNTLECDNSYASLSKCSESPGNLFLDLPTKAPNGVWVLHNSFIKPADTRNPKVDRCYKLY